MGSICGCKVKYKYTGSSTPKTKRSVTAKRVQVMDRRNRRNGSNCTGACQFPKHKNNSRRPMPLPMSVTIMKRAPVMRIARRRKKWPPQLRWCETALNTLDASMHGTTTCQPNVSAAITQMKPARPLVGHNLAATIAKQRRMIIWLSGHTHRSALKPNCRQVISGSLLPMITAVHTYPCTFQIRQGALRVMGVTADGISRIKSRA